MQDREDNGILKKRLVKVLLVILLLAVSTLIGIAAYAENMLSRIDRVQDSDFKLESLQQTDLPIFETAVLGCRSDTVNLLLIGQDRRPGLSNISRSDAMILCTVNQRNKTITLTSFLRDMYLPIPGYQSNRINAAYAIGGVELLNRCIEENFGVKIDGNVVVDFSAFIDVINHVGGVDVELTEAEAKYLNQVRYRDQIPWDTGLKEGSNLLDGSQALAYARVRKISGNDFARTKRQRKVLVALFDKVSSLSLPELHQLINVLLQKVSTDLSNTQIIGYGLQVLPAVRNYEIQSQQIPESGTFRDERINGMQVLVPDLEKNRKILEEIVS